MAINFKILVIKLVKKFFNYFNIDLVFNRNKKMILDLRELENFNQNLYNLSREKSNSSFSDNDYKKLRFNFLEVFLEDFINKKKTFNDFVECGCWKGQSTYIIASLIKKARLNIKLNVFDSFEGLSDFCDVDKSKIKNQSHQDKLSKYFKSDLDVLRNNTLQEFDFINYYKGWIPEKFVEIKDKTFSFIHIDVDLYQPTYDSISFFYPRLEKDGIIICDDYNSSLFPGAKKAFDEYLENKNYSNLIKIPTGGICLIK